MTNNLKPRDIAFQGTMLDLLEDILGSADNAEEMGRHLTQRLRELTGTRTVILAQNLGAFSGNSYRTVSVEPKRRTSLAQSTQVKLLLKLVTVLDSATLWHSNDEGPVAQMLEEIGVGLSIAVPLKVGTDHVGAVLLLDLPTAHRAEQIMEILNMLSPAVALVFRNTLLLEQQEAMVQERTSALRESEHRYRALFDDSSAAVFILDLQGYHIAVNQKAADMLKYTQEELIGRPLKDIVAPKDYYPMVTKWLSAMLDGEQLPMVTCQLQDRDHKIIPTEIMFSLVHDCEGQPHRFQIMAQDISERERAEQALRASELKFRSLIKQSSDWITLTDENGVIVEWNRGAELMTGLKREAVLGQNLWDIQFQLAPEEHHTPERYQQLKHMIKSLYDTHTAPWLGQPIESEIQRRDGTRRTIQAITFPIRLNEDFMAGAIIRDMTEKKEAEKALRNYSERLEEMVEQRTKELEKAQERLLRRQKLATLGQLAGSVGHELRNPLGTISNAVYFLKAVLDEQNETVTEYLNIISDEITKADKIVHDLLDFGRVQTTDKCVVTVDALVHPALTTVSMPQNVTLNSNVQEGLPQVWVDPQQIQQVLTNLISNAYEAMPDGGEVTIDIISQGDVVKLTVIDTGKGIAPEDMEQIFEPLFTTKKHGIGLGLALSKSFIEANSGTIEVESTAGQGTTFTITLPVAE